MQGCLSSISTVVVILSCEKLKKTFSYGPWLLFTEPTFVLALYDGNQEAVAVSLS